jgi:HAE1 family hydrophobic/amphiphilic exporter-1
VHEYRSAQINGSAAAGYNSGQATAALEEVFAQTFLGNGLRLPGISLRKAQKGTVTDLRVLVIVCFLILATYESWSLPFSVLLSMVTVFGAFGVLWLRRVVLGAFTGPMVNRTMCFQSMSC